MSNVLKQELPIESENVLCAMFISENRKLAESLDCGKAIAAIHDALAVICGMIMLHDLDSSTRFADLMDSMSDESVAHDTSLTACM